MDYNAANRKAFACRIRCAISVPKRLSGMFSSFQRRRKARVCQRRLHLVKKPAELSRVRDFGKVPGDRVLSAGFDFDRPVSTQNVRPSLKPSEPSYL